MRRIVGNRSLAPVAVFVALFCFGQIAGLGQSQNTGTIAGNVTDALGLVVTNATVTLTSVDEGTISTVNVNERGEYLFAAVKAGTYTLKVSAPGFEGYQANTLSINASENFRLDAKLQVGSTTESVVVEAPSVTVDTRSATLATVIDPTLVQNLPVDGNNVVELAALLPGVTDVSAPTTFTSDTGGPRYVVSGSRSNQNLFLFDGIMWNNVYYNTGLNFAPPLMLQETSVQLVNFKAQYGRNVGSVFNVLTKSGTNQIHGTVWEYIQNKALNAADYISRINPFLVQNQFGATVGGPIVRDKLFFFLGYQDLRSVAEASSIVTLPTAAERGLNPDGVTPRPCSPTGQFAGKVQCASFADEFPYAPALLTGTFANGLENPLWNTRSQVAEAATEITSTANTPAGAAQGAAQCLQDLANTTNEYLVQAEVPSECFNPVAVNLFNKYFPIPEVNGVPVSIPTPITSVAKQPRNDQNGLSRIDWNISGRHIIDARFYVTNTNDVTANSVGTANNSPATYEEDKNIAGIYDGNIGERWVVSPNLLNEVRVGYKRYTYKTLPLDPTTLITLGSNVNDPGVPSLPRLSASGYFALGSTSSSYSYNVNASGEIDDNVSWQRGNHNFQFGGQILDLAYIHRYDMSPQISSNGSYTGNGLVDFTFGLIGSETFGNRTNISAAEHAFYTYFQDDWRASARLTLNLGLRYELPMPWYQPDGQSTTYIYGYQSNRFLNSPSSLAYQGDPGVPNSIINKKWNNFAPRFGLVYDLAGDGKTTLRAGFGVFYDALNANTTGIGEPYHYQATFSVPPGSFSQPLLGETPSTVPANYTSPAKAVFGQPYSINFADPNVTQPYTFAVNVGIQRRLAATTTLQIMYVGKFGRHEIVPYDLNPAILDCNPSGSYYLANPVNYCTGATQKGASYASRVKYPGFNYGGAGIVDNNAVGTSNYNGLQVIYTQRSRKSLTTIASYTYSRSIDDQSVGTTNASALPEPSNGKTGNVALNYAASDFQSTHILNGGWVLKLPNKLTGNIVERAIVNDWTFTGIFQARTGSPVNIAYNGDVNWSDEPGQRPPLAPGLTKYVPIQGPRHRVDKKNEWFNFCSFASNTGWTAGVSQGGFSGSGSGGSNGVPPSPTINTANNVACNTDNIYKGVQFGQGGGPYLNTPVAPNYTNGIARNFLYGPAFIESDWGVRRTINFPWEGKRLEIRAEAFNVFNTPNLANPTGTISAGSSVGAPTGSGNHAEITSTAGKNGTVGTNGRRVQLAFVFYY
jgi:hypothetical protein